MQLDEPLKEEQDIEVQPELLAYLDDLLCLRSSPAHEESKQQPLPDDASLPPVLPAESVSIPTESVVEPELQQPAAISTVPVGHVHSPVTVNEVPVAVEESSSEQTVPPEVTGDGLFNQQSFTCLMVESAGIRYAIPLVQLGRIVRAERSPVPVGHQSSAFLGLLPAEGRGSQKVFSLERLIGRPDASGPIAFYVALADETHVFPCQALHGCIEVRRDSVRWGKAERRLPLLAGILKDTLCPLLDFSVHHW